MTTRMNPASSRRPGAAGAQTLASRGRRALPEPPRLLVTAGPGKGSEHALSARSATVGRAPQNLLVLEDLAVSRRHSRIEKQGDRWVLLDQGSGNGTRVNGTRVERHALRHGDEIEMGQTKLRFVEPGGVLVNGAQVPPAARAPLSSAARKKMALWAALGIALALAVSGYRRLRPEPAPEVQDDESRAFARKRFQEGIALLGQGKWTAARDKLRIAVELDGQDQQIARYVQAVEDEAPRAAQLETAREALQRKDYDTARGALAGIPDDSVLAANAAALRKQLREAEKPRADPLPARKPPTRRTAPVPIARPSVQPAQVRQILDAYLAGDFAEALRRAQGTRGPAAAHLLSDLEAFTAAYREGTASQQAGREAAAVRKLEEARALDVRIAGGSESRLGRALAKVLSVLHSRIAAALPPDDEALPVAGAHLARAVADDPENAAAQALLRKLASRCSDIYLRAYVEKEEDPRAARKDFALVAAALPASDETAQKARRWVEKLDRKQPEAE